MWIVIRLVLAVIGYVVRQLSRGSMAGDPTYVDGVEIRVELHKNKNTLKGHTMWLARKSPTWIRFHAESATDRWFKRLGVANEVQTGDAAFDETVYVTCDHPFVAQLLTETDLRAAVLDLLANGASHIRFNGTAVGIRSDRTTPPMSDDLQRAKRLWEASWKLEHEPRSRFSDPFLWKAIVVEGVIWSILFFAIGAGLQMIWHKEDFHVSAFAVWKTGLVLALVAFAVLFALVFLWMRGSSRGHRVIVESAVVLLLGLPIASVQIGGDTNRARDDGPPVITTRVIHGCDVREHRSRRGRRSYTYHLRLGIDAEGTGPALPDDIETTKRMCDATMFADTAEVQVMPGRWGVPWYKQIRIGDAIWTPAL